MCIYDDFSVWNVSDYFRGEKIWWMSELSFVKKWHRSHRFYTPVHSQCYVGTTLIKYYCNWWSALLKNVVIILCIASVILRLVDMDCTESNTWPEKSDRSVRPTKIFSFKAVTYGATMATNDRKQVTCSRQAVDYRRNRSAKTHSPSASQ